MFYVYLPDKQGGIPITADRLLRSIGASGRYTGFDYAVYMIEQVVDSPESIRLIPGDSQAFQREAPFRGTCAPDADQCLLDPRGPGRAE